MTYEEALDQVAKEHGYVNWDHAEQLMDFMIPGSYYKETAELYGKSKWDEAATLTNRNIIHHTNLTTRDLPAKPEFKP